MFCTAIKTVHHLCSYLYKASQRVFLFMVRQIIIKKTTAAPSGAPPRGRLTCTAWRNATETVARRLCLSPGPLRNNTLNAK